MTDQVHVHNALEIALAYLDRLESAGIVYRLEKVRDALMVTLAIPGERWEVEFFEDGHVEIERFKSIGEIEDELALEQLIHEFIQAN